MYWNATGEYRPGTTDKTITWILQDVPRNLSALAVLNPTSARTVYEWAFMDPVFDGLIAVDPWSSCDEPWLATEWTIASYQGPENGYAEGMQVTFTLRTTDSQGQPINWQDGIPISSSDVKFAWEFIRDWQIPRYRTFSKHITNVTLVDSAHIIAFFNITSIWFHYDLARTALMFPPQVWDRSWPNLAAILAYVPTGPYDPAPGYTPGPTPPPTNLFGTGPFAFRLYDPIGLYGDLDANRNYWLTTEEALAKISYYFWRLGDTDLSGDIGPLDLWIMNTHFGEIGVPPGPPGSDITGPPLDPAPLYSPPDGRVDVHDTFTLGKNFGKYLETDP